MVTHSSILAWRIQWREEPGGLQSMGSQRGGRTERLSMRACACVCTHTHSSHTHTHTQSSHRGTTDVSADPMTLPLAQAWYLEDVHQVPLLSSFSSASIYGAPTVDKPLHGRTVQEGGKITQGRLQLTFHQVSWLPLMSSRFHYTFILTHPGNLLLLRLGPNPAGSRPACYQSLKR